MTEEQAEWLEAQIEWSKKYGHMTLHELTDLLEQREAEIAALETQLENLEYELREVG
jgi:hypothetical protein